MLTQLFAEDSRFCRFMMKLWDLIVLNLLWLVTSLFLVTIGASTTALYAVMFQAAENEEGYIARRFFKEFKRNFRQATVIWLILLGVMAVMMADLYIMGRLNGMVDGTLSGIVVGVVTVVLVCSALTFLYVFPMQARYENTVPQTIYKSFVFSIRHFGCTFQMFGVILLPLGITLVIGMVSNMGWSWCAMFYLLAGVSTTSYWMVKGPWKRLRDKIE